MDRVEITRLDLKVRRGVWSKVMLHVLHRSVKLGLLKGRFMYNYDIGDTNPVTYKV